MENQKKCVVLGVTGSIAAYKAVEIVRGLQKKDVSVYVIMTQAACEFIAPLTFENLTGHPVAIDMFSRETPWEIEHIALAKKADAFLVAPATANFIGKYTAGIADDMLTTTIMATKAPVLIAPAMNTAMYESIAMSANIDVLKQRGCTFISPEIGLLACGDVGKGKLADVDDIVKAILQMLSVDEIKQDLLHKRVLVTAGPTQEAIDPVRYITNHSSGKMGYAIASAAQKRGAIVTLVSGPTSLAVPENVSGIDVVSTNEMKIACEKAFDECDICIMAAAPADYTIKEYTTHKLKKTADDSLTLQLVQTPDILQALAERKTNQFVCGFAAETQDVEHYAMEKLKKKKLDMIAANDVSRKEIGFHSDENALVLFDKEAHRSEIPQMSKELVANALLDEIIKRG